MYILYTAAAVALYFAVSLKLLHVFHVINWNPIKFMKQWTFYDWTTFEKWSILFLLLTVVSVCVYFVARTVIGKSPFVFSLILGIIAAILIEGRVLNLPWELASLKKLSIPFIVIILIGIRFIVETAQYYRKQIFR